MLHGETKIEDDHNMLLGADVRKSQLHSTMTVNDNRNKGLILAAGKDI